MIKKNRMPFAALVLGSAFLLAAAGCTQTTSNSPTAGGETAAESVEESMSAAEEPNESGEAGETAGETMADEKTVAGEMGTVPYVDNDTVVLGTYDAYEPKEEAIGHGGEVMEEDELQQERIAGGAVGEVVSQNLEPLNGIVDYSEGDYVPMYGASEKE